MPPIMKNFLSVIVILVSLNTYGQGYSLSDFKIDTLPYEKASPGLNNSIEDLMNEMEEWKIENLNDTIRIEKRDYDHFKGDSLPFSHEEVAEKLNSKFSIRAVKKVDDGYIIGLNHGEFGGGLWFLSLDGKSTYEIKPSMRIHQFFKFNEKLYVIEGLAHLGINYGNLLELKKDRVWHVSELVRLPDAPEFIIPEKNTILVLTSEHLMRLDENENLVEILKAPFNWGMLYPSSAVIESNDIYIAMRHGILKISEYGSNPHYEWYIKK